VCIGCVHFTSLFSGWKKVSAHGRLQCICYSDNS
jgi:hypothetical protein